MGAILLRTTAGNAVAERPQSAGIRHISDDSVSAHYGFDVIACYDLSSLAEVAGDTIDADTAAYSKTALGPRMVTVQEVHATKDGIIDESGSTN